MAKVTKGWAGLTIGIDLGDKNSHVCVLDGEGEVLEESKIATTSKALIARFSGMERTRIVIETGTHSNWIHDLLESLGHEVIVANARQLPLIYGTDRKDDRTDAHKLARLARVDVELLKPIDPKSAEVRHDRMLLRARAELVKVRTSLVNATRSLVKSEGQRLPRCAAAALHKQTLPSEMTSALGEVMQVLAQLEQSIRTYDDRIEELANTKYPQTKLLRQVDRVGTLTALSFVLTIGDVRRFKNARCVGTYVGLTPRKKQSGQHDPKLGITKCGDSMTRTLLVQVAHQILSRNGKDCDLKEFGRKLCRRDERTKCQAIVAVARKLSVVLFALLRSGEMYEPLRKSAKTTTLAA